MPYSYKISSPGWIFFLAKIPKIGFALDIYNFGSLVSLLWFAVVYKSSEAERAQGRCSVCGIYAAETTKKYTNHAPKVKTNIRQSSAFDDNFSWMIFFLKIQIYKAVFTNQTSLTIVLVRGIGRTSNNPSQAGHRSRLNSASSFEITSPEHRERKSPLENCCSAKTTFPVLTEEVSSYLLDPD